MSTMKMAAGGRACLPLARLPATRKTTLRSKAGAFLLQHRPGDVPQSHRPVEPTGRAFICSNVASRRERRPAILCPTAGTFLGLKMESTGRGMSGPRAEEWSPASIICRPRLNSQHVPQGGLRASRLPSDPDGTADAISGDFPAPRNRMVDSPPKHGTVGRNHGRSLGLSRNATGPGFDTPQVQSFTHSPVQVDQRELVNALSESCRALVRVQGRAISNFLLPF